MGRSNDHFKDIMSLVSAIVFLGTPHHGSNLAKILNSLLAVSNPKQYVSDLAQASPMIEDINEQFRHFVTEVKIASFYESRYTSLGLKKMVIPFTNSTALCLLYQMIVEKQSAILGCSSEIAQPLDADHHQLCKFGDKNDSNYIMVKKTLASFLPSILGRGKGLVNFINVAKYPNSYPGNSTADMKADSMEKTSTLLAIQEAPEADLNFYSDRRMPETCSWILSYPAFTSWKDSTTVGHILWINGTAGSGKSILASFLVQHFQTEGFNCMYYFFRSGDKIQRSANTFLRSIAFQIAQKDSKYRAFLEELEGSGARFEKTELRLLWQKLFVPLSTKLNMLIPIYIIVDGLDESDAPQTLLMLLSHPTDIPLNFAIVSRSSSALSSGFDKFSNSRPVTRMSSEFNQDDISDFVKRELQMMHGNEMLRRDVTGEIIKRASGNFLWVHLVTQEILDCHTQGEIEQVLETIPNGMQPLYERIEDGMAKNLRPIDQKLARTLLSWAVCAQRPLSLEELAEAIEPTFPHIIDLKHTIGYICSSLLVVDRKSRVLLIHKTAREYLTKVSTGPLAIAPATSHNELFLRCISALCDPRLILQRRYSSIPSLVTYAARSWPFHLQAQAGDSETLTALMNFLQSTSILAWIQLLSTQDQLHILVQSSRSLSVFAERRRGFDASLAPNLRPLQALEAIDLWVTDLVKIVGKFGRNLLDLPNSIFKFIPPFCPTESIIHRQFGRRSTLLVSLSRHSNATWDDSLAKLFIGAASQTLRIMCIGRYFAILTTSDWVTLWNSATCQRSSEIIHGEHVITMCASNSGKLIATYGFRTTKVWDVSNGKEILSIPNPGQGKALGLRFSKNDGEIWVGSDDRKFWRISLSNADAGWQEFGPNLFSTEAALTGTKLNSPCSIAFNPDGTQIAVAFRGAPLTVWSVNQPELLARCRREWKDGGKANARPWTAADFVLWHPQSDEVLGIYQDSAVFKWHPLDETSQDLGIYASVINCSPDGDLFAASDMHGTIKIWKYYDFVLIYQLRCEYPVTDFTFSPDNRRLYDLRGSFCNVWEPNTLIRLSELESPGSENRSESGLTVTTSMSEAEVETVEPVSAVSVSPNGDIYCIGNTEGSVLVVHHEGYEVGELWSSPSFLPIENIVWGANGTRVAFRDLGGNVIVQDVEFFDRSPDKMGLSSHTVFKATVKDEIGSMNQLLLSPQCDLILIASPSSAQVWSVHTGLCTAKWRHEDNNAAFKWLNHPLNSSHLLAIEATKALSVSWQDLAQRDSFAFSIPKSHEPSKSSSTLDRIRKPSLPRSMSSDNINAEIGHAATTQDGLHVMIETAKFFQDHNKSERQLMFFYKADFKGTSSLISPRPIPTALFDQLQLPLGILSGERFIFLNNDNWLCSYRLDSEEGPAGVKRHFFLPRDWLNGECLELCQVTANGALVVPKGGDVAWIKSDLGVNW